MLGEGAAAECGGVGNCEARGGEEWRRPMGNTLSCCVSPNASPKLGRRRGSAQPADINEAATGNVVAVAREPATGAGNAVAAAAPEPAAAAAGDAVVAAPEAATVDPGELDLGAGEGHHLQHISDREMPEGKGAAPSSIPKRSLWLLRARVSDSAHPAGSLPEVGSPGSGAWSSSESDPR